MEVVEAGFSVVDISTVTQGIVEAQRRSHRTRGSQQLAPGIVGVTHDLLAGAVQNGNHIALQIQHIVICRTAIGKGHGIATGIIIEMHGERALVTVCHLAQPATVVGIGVGSVAVCPLRAHTSVIIDTLVALTRIGLTNPVRFIEFWFSQISLQTI